MIICKSFTFDAAHWLPMVADGHKCKRMHGHTYRVEIVCAGDLDRRGMVVDYEEIAKAWLPLMNELDHRVLNEILGLENPTTEILSRFIYLLVKCDLPSLSLIRVYESSTTWCEYTGSSGANQ